MLDNRDLSLAQRYIDRAIDKFRDETWNALLHLCDVKALDELNGRVYCPSCGKLFSAAHAADRPNFCERCGQALDWPAQPGDA